MKIDGRNPTIQLDAVRAQKAKEAKQSEAVQAAKAVPTDSVDTKLSQALSSVLEGIESSGLNAGDLHSKVSGKIVESLLSEATAEVAKPKVPAELLLQFTDKVSSMMLRDPQAALRAFSDIDPNRTMELI